MVKKEASWETSYIPEGKLKMTWRVGDIYYVIVEINDMEIVFKQIVPTELPRWVK